MPRILINELDSTEKGVGGDMMLYFGNTVVKVCKDGVSTPVWAKYCGINQSKGHMFSTDGDSIFIAPHAPKAYVEWSFPTGWFNTKHTAVYCERQPKRQYLKGLSSGNFKMNTAESLAKEHGMIKTEDESLLEVMKSISQTASNFSSPSLFKAMFSDVKTYPLYEDAYVALKAKMAFSRALSEELAMLPHPESKDFIIFCHDFPVAELLTKNKLKMLVPEFKPECVAYFHKEGVSVVS